MYIVVFIVTRTYHIAEQKEENFLIIQILMNNQSINQSMLNCELLHIVLNKLSCGFETKLLICASLFGKL